MTTPADFEHDYADVNGTRLHYVTAGEGHPLVLLPGWPRTWWQFHQAIPLLAKRYRVIAVDIRGMGDSAKPESGYDKKNMARDIHELIHHLGYQRAHVSGDDIGGMVSFSLAWNHPESVAGLVIGDGMHPNPGFESFSMIRKPGQLVYPWWWATGATERLPESWFAGKFREIIDWNIEHIGGDPSRFSEQTRDIYAAGYDTAEAIRATNGWFRTFHQDIVDYGSYGKLDKPLLYLGGTLLEVSKHWVQEIAPNATFQFFADTGHFMPEEQPKQWAEALIKHFG
ncbi:alpha/beta hydrolase [Kutzneria sp. NPDC051319]|uniref:alpha/beta fold hydrolase n=1 Tax=Kutzneria sp. NPDC051319 TaxID=3155047 RepID=UPI00341A9D18